jgi:ubiquinone biosynthesis protein
VMTQNHRISRYYEIARILIKHGFMYIIAKKGKKYSLPQRARMVFEDLGPTFIKMGQLLSTRPDLVPREYIEEFAKLQDDVEDFKEEDVRLQFLKEFGKQPEEIFEHFNYSPLACASIGQVHEARLPGGEQVVVKVQRPFLKHLIDGDIKILRRFQGILQNWTIIGQVCDVGEVIGVFERQIHRELDYLTEAVNTEMFYRSFISRENVIVPRVYSELTTKEIFTMEYVAGIRVEEFENHEYSFDERYQYARNVFLAVFCPLFEKGVFHGDPHPGNVLFQDQYKVVLIDFGIVGRFDRDYRRKMAELIVALADRDVTAVMEIILETGKITKPVHRQHFFEDVSEIVEKANGVTSGGIGLGSLINGMIAIAINHKIKIPDSLFILGKTVMLAENLARRICPDIDIAEIIRPIAAECMKEAMYPDMFMGNKYKRVSDVSEAIMGLPRDVCQAVRNLANNETTITFYHRNLNWLHDMLDVASSRASFGLILAALIVGSAVIMHTGKGPLLWGYPVLGTVGFLLSGLLGSFVVISILRSGRLK